MKRILSYNKFNIKESFDWSTFINKAKHENNYHQEILNFAYDGYNVESQGGFSFPELIEWTEKNMGEDFALLVFLGKYNQQVTNGGHSQYHGNGYDGSSGDTDGDTPLHDEMVQLFKQLGYDKLHLGDKVLDIMSKYAPVLHAEDCDECGGSGYVEDDEEEDDEDEFEDDDIYEGWGGTYSCGMCGGTGESRDDYTIYVDEKLDTEYYKIYDEWMKTLEHKAKEVSNVAFAKELDLDLDKDELDIAAGLLN